MEESFDKILDKKYRVDIDSVKGALVSLGYDITKSIYGISATKYIKDYRFHIIINLLPISEIDRYCYFNIHKDSGIQLFHCSIYDDDDISTEFKLFRNTLTNIIKRKNLLDDIDGNQKYISQMLRDIDTFEKHFDHNQGLIIFINKFRKALNVLFEMVKDEEEDFKRNLVVLLLDIVDQIDIDDFKLSELMIIKDMTKSLLNPVTGEKLDYYVDLAIEKNLYRTYKKRNNKIG